MNWQAETLSLRDGTQLDWERVTLDTGEMRLAVARLQCPSPVGPEPIVLLTGGPGEPTLRFPRHAPFLTTLERARASRDVILLDQRGCGESGGLPPLGEGAPVDQGDDALRAWIATRPAFSATPEAYTVLRSATDVAALSKALGAPLMLLAHSYGTHLAQFVMRHHPGAVASALLLGFEGPDQTLKLPSRVDAALARASAVAGLDLAEVARREDLAVGSGTIQRAIGASFGLRSRLGPLVEWLRRVLGGEGSFEFPAKLWASKSGVFFLKDAASGATPARLARIAHEAGGTALGDAMNFPFPQIGPLIGAGDIGDAERAPLRTDHPITILTGALDGFTPTENALESLDGLPNARHREIEDAFHDDLLSAEAVRKEVAAWASS